MCIISKYVFCLFGTKLFTKYNFIYIQFCIDITVCTIMQNICFVLYFYFEEAVISSLTSSEKTCKVQVKQEKRIVKWHCDMIHLCLSLLNKQEGGTIWMQSLPEFIYWPTSSSKPPYPAFIKYAFQIQTPGLALPPHKSYAVYFMTRLVRIVIKTSQYRFMVLCNLDGKDWVIFTVGVWFWAFMLTKCHLHIALAWKWWNYSPQCVRACEKLIINRL